jgi:F-type H+-transporting ATPase subunit delta
MAELSTIARPYAEAAFRLARELKDLPGWTDALARLSSVVSRPEAQAVLGNPKLSAEQVAGLIGDTSGQLTEEQKNFVHLLAKNERLSVINEINSQFQVLLSTENGIVDAHVTSAYPLTEAQADDIRKTLEAKTGKKVKVTVSVDSDLIGGVAIRIGDEVTDLSVKGKLAQLQKALVA